MFARLLGIAAAGTAASAEMPEAREFEIVSAEMGGKNVSVFVAPTGTAAAVEMGPERADVLTGLAAGGILSDIQDAAQTVASGFAASMGAEKAAAAVPLRLSAKDTGQLIDAIAPLSDGQKAQLRDALSI